MISFHLAESLFCCVFPADFILFVRLNSNILFCRLHTFGFNYTFYISCEVGLKHTFLDTGWALTEALADLIESVLTAASVLTKMRMGQDTLKMISENSLDLLYCNIYIVVEKRTLMLLQCSVRLNMQYVYFLAKDIEISIPSQSKDT